LPERFPVVKDTAQIRIEYISLKKDCTVTFDFPFYSPLLSNIKSDTLPKKKDTAVAMPAFFIPGLSHLSPPVKDTLQLKSLFFPHALKANDNQEITRKKPINDWAFIILLTSFLLMAGVQFSYHKRMTQIVRAFLAGRFLNQLLRGGDFYKERITYNLFLIYLLVFPLFLYEVNHFYGFYNLPRRPFTEVLLYLELFFLNLLVYSSKVIGLRSAGTIFKTPEITGEYIMTHFIFSLIQGVVLLVFMSIVVFTYSFIALQLSVLLVFIIYFYQMVRGFFIGLRNASYSYLYLMLFFFTIEILPILIIIKILMLSAN
jgi:hypothetical protein